LSEDPQYGTGVGSAKV